VYHQIIPYRDSEDDSFDIHSFIDIALLPNLRQISLVAVYDADLTPCVNAHGDQ
jgi:hypothetical protein